MNLFKQPWWRAIIIALAASALFIACDDSSGTDEPTEDTNPIEDTTDQGTDNVTPDDVEEDDNTPEDVPTDNVTPEDTNQPDTVVDFEWPATPEELDTTYTSFVRNLDLPEVGDDGPTCCKDWGAISKDYIKDGTDQMDNSIASLSNSLSTFGFDLGAMLTEQVEAGTVALLWNHQDFDGTTNDGDFILTGLFGEFAPGVDYAAASAGGADFNVNAAAFKPGSGEPVIAFGGASMTNGQMDAGPSTFLLTLPFGFVNLQVAVSEALVSATATVTDGVTYTAGTLSGYVALEDIVNAINALATSETCDCLGLQGDLYTYTDDTITANGCMDIEDALAACPAEEEAVCAVLAGGMATDGGMDIPVCTMLPGLLSGSADLDTDGNCTDDNLSSCFDSLSVGLEWDGVPANVAGIVTFE